MPRIIIAGDSWGAHSYEPSYIHPDLKGFKFKETKKYVLYPGPGDLLKEVMDVDTITTADHGYSNKQGLDALEKIVTEEDIVIFYQTGMLREVYKAHMANEDHHATDSYQKDFEHYENLFFERCGKIRAKHFTLIGGCVQINVTKAKQNNIHVLLPSITEWFHPEFQDNDFDPTTYWLEYQYSCGDFKNAVIESHRKIEFWLEHEKNFCKKHPTVSANRKLVKEIIKKHVENII
tara:strand:- start:563 stop:1264 length:702 start_codon:yes stop_codon:yes gene_type:complete